MTSRIKYSLVSLIIAAVGGAAIAYFSDLSFWIGTAIMVVALTINSWIAERVDDW